MRGNARMSVVTGSLPISYRCLVFTKYGHIETAEIQDFYIATCNQDIYITKYRGNCCYTKNQQAAEYFLRDHMKDFGFGSITPVADTDNNNTYRFLYQKLQQYFDVTISVSKAEEKRKLTCQGELDSSVNVFDLIRISQPAKPTS